MNIRHLLPLIVVVLLSACASVPMGDTKQDSIAKTFVAKSNVAGIYIYRNESFGAALRMDVEVDGKPIGQSAAKTYFYLDVPPGKHTFTSKSENEDTITIDVLAGKLYFIWQEVKMGLLYARTKMSLVSEEEGKRGVLESQLASTSGDPFTKGPGSTVTKEDRLTELKRQSDQGLISKDDYLERQKRILNGD
jgi:hypothetical protein